MAEDDGPPTSRLQRSARLGGLVGGQGARWVGTQAANRFRSADKADAATGARAAGLAQELVRQLGQMRGAAMKVGQVLSTVDFVALPEGEREEFKRTLASLRDDVPPIPLRKLKALIEEDLGAPMREAFADFEEEAFAAASIGQVHRATTTDGQDVAVKVQYPGVAEAVETDLRNVQVLLPLVKRLAPGLDVKALATELRDRIGEELDYELEAQNQRAVARAWRGHPYVVVPAVDTGRSGRRVLTTAYVEGARFEEVKQRPEAERDRFGEIVFRFYFQTVKQTRRVSGDPHPGNVLLLPDDRVAFLDFGLMRVLDAAHLAKEMALATAVMESDAPRVHARLAELGYLPDPESFDEAKLLEQLRALGEWYFTAGFRRLDPRFVTASIEAGGGDPRSPLFEQVRRQTLPAEALLLRRMEGLVLQTLAELRAGADWNAIGREFWADAPPSTPLGELDATFWAGRTSRAAA